MRRRDRPGLRRRGRGVSGRMLLHSIPLAVLPLQLSVPQPGQIFAWYGLPLVREDFGVVDV